MSRYSQKHFTTKVSTNSDNITVEKSSQSDWVQIKTTISDGFVIGKIELRSLESLQQLHFLLGQLLSNEE